MKRRLRGRSIHELNRDYLDLLARVEEEELDEDLVATLRSYRRFIERNAHRIGPHPGALLPVAHSEPLDSPVRAEACRREADGPVPQGSWFRLLHPPVTDPNPALVRVLVGHTDWVWSVALSADGRHALSGSCDGTLRYWDFKTHECLATLKGHTGWVMSVAFSADGRHALSGGRDGTLRYWDLKAHKCLATLAGHMDAVWSVAVSTDGRHALSGSEDGALRYWDLKTHQCLATLEGHTGEVSSVTLSADGRHALSGSYDRTLRWWDLQTGGYLALFPCDYPIRCVALTPKAPWTACAVGDRGNVYFFRIEEGAG